MPDRDSSRAARGKWPAALAADLIAVLAFAATGRRNHDEGLTVAGLAQTAWPFLTGTLIGWLLIRGWRRPAALRPTGLAVWLCTVAIGMALRKLTSAGTAASFIAVASVAIGALLLGWRAALAGVRRRGLPATGHRRSGS